MLSDQDRVIVVYNYPENIGGDNMTRKLTATRQGIRVSLKGNASIADQKAWQLLPSNTKRRLSNKLKNADGDKIPDGYDCRFRDKLRQESFLPADQKLIKNLKTVKPGKLLSHGGAGNVNTVEGLPGFVVKTPVNKANSYYDRDRADGFEYERKFYSKHKLLDEPLFIPTKEVKIGNKSALLRPTVTVISEPNRDISRKITNKVSNAQLEIMRQKIIQLSNRGYMFYDGFQIGIDSSGRLLAYDCGEMMIVTAKQALAYNNKEWLYFLIHIGKARTDEEAAAKYGRIKRGA